MWVLPTVEQSAKCHLSTCALMINTILMVSINFLLHHQKAAVALSLSQPCACFGKPFCGSCWMEIVCSSLPHTHNFSDRCTKHAHAQSHIILSYANTHAHYYTLLCSLHFTHLHTDKQIKCNSVFLLNHFFKGDLLCFSSQCSEMIKTLFRAPEIQLRLCVQCSAAILQTTTLTWLCDFGIAQPPVFCIWTWCDTQHCVLGRFLKPMLWFLHNPLPCSASTYL